MPEEKNKPIVNNAPLHHQNLSLLRVLKVVILGVLGFAVIMFIFGAGIFVGQKRAEFSFRWAENYHRNFGGPRTGIFGNFPAQDFINGHGVFGSVISINGNTIMVKGENNIETTVVVSGKTTIRNNSAVLKLSDIKVDDTVVIIGSPDTQGEIDAKFIRILPAGLPVSVHTSTITIYQNI